jgi:hypothetical protein
MVTGCLGDGLFIWRPEALWEHTPVYVADEGHSGSDFPLPIEKFCLPKIFLRRRPGTTRMVSFSCESCQDTIKKPKLENVHIFYYTC